MTADPAADPSPRALGESLAALAVQVAALRGQIHAINQRLDQAGLRADLNLAERFEDLAQAVADALDTAGPRGPAAPYWIGLDPDTYHARLADLRRWADTVLRQHYGSYELADCWPRHIHAIWELSTLAAEWHHTYGGKLAVRACTRVASVCAPPRPAELVISAQRLSASVTKAARIGSPRGAGHRIESHSVTSAGSAPSRK